MDGEEELLQPEGPRLPRRVRVGAVVLAGLAIATLIVVKVWPRSTSHHAAATTAPPPPSTLYTLIPQPGSPSATGPTTTPRPWPTAPGACDGTSALPIVTSRHPAERTGIRVLLGGDRLRTVDFDTGRQTEVAELPAGEFVTALRGRSATQVTTSDCTGDRSRLLLLRGGRVTAVTSPLRGATLLADGERTWAVTYPDDQHSRGEIASFAGGRPVRLPVGFTASGVVGRLVAGNGLTTSAFNEPGQLLLVDAATGRVRANLGPGLVLATGHGLLLWTSGCTAGSDRPCTLHRRVAATGATARYPLPRPADSVSALSDDGRQVAFMLERPGQDPRFDQGHPIPPSNIAVLHLDTGRLDIVPGVETHAKSTPALAYSPDGRWLVISLDAGPRSRLLAWHAGLGHPYESAPVPGTSISAPPVVVLPS